MADSKLTIPIKQESKEANSDGRNFDHATEEHDLIEPSCPGDALMLEPCVDDEMYLYGQRRAEYRRDQQRKLTGLRR